jgi:tRNA modification GTPase
MSVVLVGAPNAGKSSLLNALLKSDRAIVTSIPGTTRDVIEESIDIAGIPVRLTDTAGLRETSDEVERIGVERTRAAMAQADIVVEVIDATLELRVASEDLGIPDGLPRILALNKCDLICDKTRELSEDSIYVSAKTGHGLERLEAKIAEIALGAGQDMHGDGVIISHTRHKSALISSCHALDAAAELLNEGQPLDLVSIELTSALTAIGQITGETAPEEIVNEIFHRFCIGK